MELDKMNIYEKLSTIQTMLKAPKGKYNSFGKYYYRSCEDILEATKPLLARLNLNLMLTDEPVFVGDWHFVRATATLTNIDNPHEQVTVSANAHEPATKKGMDESQITGTASSYARKYALNGLFLIDDTKDADTDEYHNERNNRAQKQAERREELYSKVEEMHSNDTHYCSDCHQPITAAWNMSAPTLAMKTLKSVGRELCADCYTKIKKGENAE